MIKLQSLSDLKNCEARTERSLEEGGESLFDELISLLKLKCQQLIKVASSSRQVKTWSGVA